MAQLSPSLFLPSDGFLSYDQGYTTTFKIDFEIDNFCKLEMSGMEEHSVSENYSRNISWTMDGCLHQLVKIGDNTDDRVFHQVPETWHDLVKRTLGGRQLIANLKRTSLMVKARSVLRARNNQPQRRRDLVKQLMST